MSADVPTLDPPRVPVPATATPADAPARLNPPASRQLVRKLAEVMAVIERVPKNGYNEFHKYAYALEADIVAAVRQELAQRHVMIIPGVTGQQRVAVGDRGNTLTLLDMTFTFYDGDTGEEIQRPWSGAGTDKEDKGTYKAMTGAEKYFILKTFLMPTGDDPEADEKPAGKRATKPAPAKSAPAPARGAAEDSRPITTKGADGTGTGQLGRLRAVIRERVVDAVLFAAWMTATYGYTKGEQIQRRHYDAIVAQAEKGGVPDGWTPPKA